MEIELAGKASGKYDFYLVFIFYKEKSKDQSKSLFLIFCKPALDVGLGVEKIEYSYNSFLLYNKYRIYHIILPRGTYNQGMYRGTIHNTTHFDADQTIN